MTLNLPPNSKAVEKASLPKTPRKGAAGLGLQCLFPKNKGVVVPFCSIVSVKIISVASGCASTLGGMVKGVMCLSHYSAPKCMTLGTSLASAFPILSGVFSHLV